MNPNKPYDHKMIDSLSIHAANAKAFATALCPEFYKTPKPVVSIGDQVAIAEFI